MAFTKQLGNESLKAEELKKDKKECRRFGPCGVGEKALYLNSFYLERAYYVTFYEVKRIYKRIAMSKGGFTGKGVFASIPYLVVEFRNGTEKQCNFKIEDQVDDLLAYVREKHPEIPTVSAAAEKKLAEKQKRIEAKKRKMESAKASETIRELDRCKDYMEKRPTVFSSLSSSAKRRRAYDRSKPAYKWVALAITLMGGAAAVYGIYALLHKEGTAMYFLLFGLAAIFLFSGANVLPTARNNKTYIYHQFDKALADITDYVKQYPGFPLPPEYAHPVVISRIQEILADERAGTVEEALEVLKSDLKALNASVEVEQEEFDEIMAIKPIFLVLNYR